MKYFLSIVAIFKNEENILIEWLEHYLMEGVEHFYLIDNGSTDGYQKIIERYVKEKLVDINIDSTPHKQIEHYNSYYLDKVKKESKWVMIVDLDELIYSRKQFKSISCYLKSLQSNIAQVYVPWKIFGSSGYIEQPSKCIDNFIMRTQYNHKKNHGMVDTEKILTKTIVKTEYLTKMTIHCAITNGNNIIEITSDNQIISSGDTYKYINEGILENSVLHCNHYPIQSYEYFKKIKMSRGSANTQKFDKIRNIEYYNSFDSQGCQLVDKELSIKRNIIKAYYGNETYYDVTRCLYDKFMDKSNKKIIIGENIQFNDYFGDPSPCVIKFLIIKQKEQLKIFTENGHGKIVIEGL
jgi:hypothetical protein